MKKKNFAIKTLRQAKRLITIVIGFTVLVGGAAMLFLPGPGIVTIIVGLAILGTEFVWARKLYKRFEDKATDIKDSFLNTHLKNAKKKMDSKDS
jgi:uncharacterized protein (TIGR02611 family)